MKLPTLIIAALTGLAGPAMIGPPAAWAGPPAALVEDVQGDVAGAELMDYVAPGQVIKLGPDGAVVMSYLKSCRRETVNGAGSVTVGPGESTVDGATLKSDIVNCDASHAQATSRETSEVAATIVRSVGPDSAPVAQAIIYSASPIFEAKGRGTLIVERLDQPGERQQVELSGRQYKGRFYDFAGTSHPLTPGGTYVASFSNARIVFKVDAQAKAGPGPAVGRLIRFN
ncbi:MULTISPECIES: hypothetical protein [unclassified Bradyrhizobium]|uniref:hypothetical protein n=1 Tax=unclassified Bradyrhizobium TaxID=2631580 RepID=UPI0028EF2760|nr:MULTISPECIES: hypothetical protein [unclassified Bradyrhizobium]